jgi:hypothetical protein
VLSTLRRRVAAHARDANRYKIGRTSYPESRFREAYAAEYDEMVVVYETTTIDHADEVERTLTEFFYDSANFVRGGGGREGPPPHYIYVVVAR